MTTNDVSSCGNLLKKLRPRIAGPSLQTSALPLGYGAETRKLAIYMEFLNPPRERFQTPASQTSASQFGHAAATEIDSHLPIAFLNSPASVPATVGIFVGTHDSPRPAPSCGSRTL